MEEKLLSPEEVSNRLGLNIQTVRRWLRSGKLPGIKMSYRTWRVRESDLEEFLRKQEKR